MFDFGSRRLHKSLNIEHVGAVYDCPNQVRKDRADRVDRGDRLPKSSPCSHRLHLQWESESDWERGAQTLNIEHVAVGAVYDRPNQVRNIIA